MQPLNLVKSGEVVTAAKVNEVIDRVNAYSNITVGPGLELRQGAGGRCLTVTLPKVGVGTGIKPGEINILSTSGALLWSTNILLRNYLVPPENLQYKRWPVSGCLDADLNLYVVFVERNMGITEYRGYVWKYPFPWDEKTRDPAWQWRDAEIAYYPYAWQRSIRCVPDSITGHKYLYVTGPQSLQGYRKIDAETGTLVAQANAKYSSSSGYTPLTMCWDAVNTRFYTGECHAPFIYSLREDLSEIPGSSVLVTHDSPGSVNGVYAIDIIHPAPPIVGGRLYAAFDFISWSWDHLQGYGCCTEHPIGPPIGAPIHFWGGWGPAIEGNETRPFVAEGVGVSSWEKTCIAGSGSVYGGHPGPSGCWGVQWPLEPGGWEARGTDAWYTKLPGTLSPGVSGNASRCRVDLVNSQAYVQCGNAVIGLDVTDGAVKWSKTLGDINKQIRDIQFSHDHIVAVMQ